MKKILIVVAMIVGVVVAAMLVLVSRLDGLIKSGVESIGPKVTQVNVKLDRVSLNLLDGHGAIHGLLVGNPQGYKSDAAMKLEETSLTLAPGSLLSDKVHVKSIAIVAPEITVEGGLKNNNLTRILANVQAYAGPGKTNQAESTATSQKKLQVDSLVLRGAKVTAQLDLLGGKPLSLTLPDVELTGLGQGPDGITPADLGARILDVVINKTLEAVAASATQLGKQAIDNAAGSASDAVKGAADKALKGVGDLLKKKEK